MGLLIGHYDYTKSIIGADKMLGIKCIWECPSCGSQLENSNPFWNKAVRKKIEEPNCACGRKGEMRLIEVEQCRFQVENNKK